MRGLLKLTEMESNQPNPEAAIMEAIEAVDAISEAIRARENDCLKRIYTRFCLLKGKMIDPGAVTPKNYAERKNFTNYYYKFGTPEQYWLMSAELIIENNEPKLNIMFSPELTKDNEL